MLPLEIDWLSTRLISDLIRLHGCTVYAAVDISQSECIISILEYGLYVGGEDCRDRNKIRGWYSEQAYRERIRVITDIQALDKPYSMSMFQ